MRLPSLLSGLIPGLFWGLSWALAPLLAVGCHDLPDLGTCGNGVIEAANGEACDEGGVETATCTSTCLLKCVAMDAAPKGYVAVESTTVSMAAPVLCPDDRFRCGSDGICRASSGAFEPLAAPLTFDIGAFPVVGDADNDGLPDLIGTSATSIYIRFGSSSGVPLGEVVVQDAPSSEAAFAIFDRDPGRSDPARSNMMIGVPTEGLGLLRSDNERFEPELDLSLPLPSSPTGLVVNDPDPALGEVIVTVQAQSPSPTIRVTRVEVPSPLAVVQPTAPPLVPQAFLPDCVGNGTAGQTWKVVKVVAAPDRRSFAVITAHDQGLEWHVCRYTPDLQNKIWNIDGADFVAAATKRVPAAAVLANVDADPCLELVLTGPGMPGAPKELFGVDASGPSCSFVGGSLLAPMFSEPTAEVLAAGQIDPATPLDELVLARGVYRACTGLGGDCKGAATGTYVSVAQPTKVPWHAAAVVDLNGDGALDVVAARGGEPDVDVARGGALPAVYRVSTSDPIVDMVAGDFDGDRLGDAAMVEATPQGDRITVLFGSQEGVVQAPRPMSGPTNHLVLDRFHETRWGPSRRSDDGFDDLLVVGIDPASNTARVGLVLGDAARLMTTPRFPPVPTTGGSLPTIAAIAAGKFLDDRQEMLALEGPQVLLYDVASPTPRWSPPIPIPLALAPPMVALRNKGGLARIAGWSNQSIPPPSSTEVTVFSVGGGAFSKPCKISIGDQLRGLRVVDVDGDGIDEVAVLTSPAAATPMGMSPPPTLRLFDAASCQERLADVLADSADVASVGDALVVIHRPEKDGAARELVIFRRVDPAGDRYEQVGRRVPLQGEGAFVSVGDFDGDGVPDAAVGVRRVNAISVQLMRQCPAHDLRTCTTGP